MAELVRIQASGLPELFDCPARWEAKNIRGLRMPASGGAQLGAAVHAGTALYDLGRIRGAGLSAEDCAEEVAATIRRPGRDVDWGDMSPEVAEGIALALHRKYCNEVSARFEFADVEAECRGLELPELGLSLTGTVDRVYRDEAGRFGIADIKTGKTAVGTDGTVRTAGHAAQLAVYELLAEEATGRPMDAPAVVIGLQTAKTEAGRRAGTGSVTGARELLAGTEEAPGLLEAAAELLRSGMFFGNPRSTLCHQRYCPIHGVCRFRR